MLNNNCFDCLNSLEGIPAENNGWYHPCKFGRKNENLQDIKNCCDWQPNKGFQMGGYYTHTHFEGNGDGCLTLVIHGNLKNPSSDPKEWTSIHICDFEQIKEWVNFWDKILNAL